MPDDNKSSSASCPRCGQPLLNGSIHCKNCSSVDALRGIVTLEMETNALPSKKAEVDPLIGRIIEGKYEISERLGGGGMGDVYRARRTNKLPDVAIKFLKRELVSDSAALQRFIREAQIAGSIDHPNVITIYDWTKIEDEKVPAFIVMELIKGTTLASIINQERPTVSRAVALMCEICEGIGTAHRMGIIHRDIKPANVMIARDSGGQERIKVLDFGLAKLFQKTDASFVTESGVLVGTPIYMSPEQFRGIDLTARSDVFSLAAVMYEMLTGVPPFMGDTPITIYEKQERAPAEFERDLRIPRKLSEVIQTALSIDPANRPADANEFSQAVRNSVMISRPVPRTSVPISRPDRFDFGIISGDLDTISSIKEVLRLDSPISVNPTGRILYYWGAVLTEEGKQAYVVLSTPIERQAHATDGEVVRNMIDVCDPEFILVLGTARGLKAAGSQLGQVVYSRLLRSANSSSLNHEDFVEARNLPPDGRLIRLARLTESNNHSRRALRLKKGKAPVPKFNPPPPIATEIFSTPNGHDDYNSQVFQTIRNLYPRVAAIESDAESVATTLLHMVEGGRNIGYLLIKGITDIIDDETLPEERKKRRQSWTQYASFASATFARSLIQRWRARERRVPTIPAAYLEILSGADHNRRARVFHRLYPETYSELCRKICSDENGIKKVFAVCEFEPTYFIQKITSDSGYSADDLMRFDEASFMRYANGVFPHFEAFRSLSERGIEVSRVVLAKDSYDEWRRRNTDLNIELFKKLNGRVACFLAEARALRTNNLLHITDHVIFNSKLMLDYYDDSQTLIMTYDEDGLDVERVKFENHFYSHRELRNLYRPLNI